MNPWVRGLRGLNFYVGGVGYMGKIIFYVGHNFYLGCVGQMYFCVGQNFLREFKFFGSKFFRGSTFLWWV